MQVNLFMFHFKNMKKFLIGITLFFAVMVAADFIFGKVMYFAESQSSSQNYHCMYEADEDVLILGSSFAVRNLVPSVIEDALGVSCYNAGEAGNGSMVAWVRYNMFIKNHIPKLIIYALTPQYDYVKSDDYTKYLNIVKPYFSHEESVVNMYEDLMSWSDRLILSSNFVKFNSYGAQLVYYWLSKKNIGLQGYEPLYGTFIPHKNDELRTKKEYEIDEQKMGYLELLFDDITNRGIPIICILTPDYREDFDLYQYKEGLLLCEKYDIRVINHKYYDGISQNNYYFYDKGHLNDTGARFYSSLLCNELEQLK